ncbi:MAG: glycine cleavage system protein H [Bacillus thermozeamaize]|jgi:glycine cleavage system H protein|uniref:Glycine cleavage system H protein n=1 Tax=Bacillus thermozeamaize TaxID=230954 RepID=A0A1Y3PGG0_9BACI|nr:MAG: glycine cleavage system protein H [Bacillus thermozeamaize]
MLLPKELKYSAEHEWVKAEGTRARIGITDFAQSELGDIVFIELPEVGDEVTAGEAFGSIESVKTVSDLYSPVTGQVVEVNKELEDNLEWVNESPYEKGWMIVVEMSDPSELERLLSAEEYEAKYKKD